MISHINCVHMTLTHCLHAGQTLPYIHALLIYHELYRVCDLFRSDQQMCLRVFATFKSEKMWTHIFL